MRILRAKKPSLFLLENVPGILSAGKPRGAAFELIVSEFEACGYEVACHVVDAAFLLPQRRSRVYFCGRRVDDGVSLTAAILASA